MFLCQICSALFASEEEVTYAKETQKEREEEKKKEAGETTTACVWKRPQTWF